MMSQLADENLDRYEKEFDNIQDVFELQVYVNHRPPLPSEVGMRPDIISHYHSVT